LKSIGFHSKIKLDEREFHIHTGNVNVKNQILSEIFEEGKYIAARQVDYKKRQEGNDSTQEGYLKSIASKLHNETLEEINMLFQVNSKIRMLKQHNPHFKLGSVFYERNFLEEAIDNFLQVIELKHDYIPAYVRLGKSYLKLGENQKAVDILEKGFNIQPEFPDIANSLGVARTFLHDYEGAIEILQHAIKKNPVFDEANFNLGVALFLSTVIDSKENDKVVVPSRVIRFIKSLKGMDRYNDDSWQELFQSTLDVINEGKLGDIVGGLENLQLKLITHIKLNSPIESFYLKFMYGGHELSREELESYENKIRNQSTDRENFADYWNELGTIHMIQCRNLFLKSLNEFKKAVDLNDNYDDAKKNLELIRNNKKGFLILLRAILK